MLQVAEEEESHEDGEESHCKPCWNTREHSCSSGTRQLPLLFPIHLVAARTHGLGMPGYLLGMDDPEGGQRGGRRGGVLPWEGLKQDGHSCLWSSSDFCCSMCNQTMGHTLRVMEESAHACAFIIHMHTQILEIPSDPASPVCTHLLKGETHARSSRDN